MILPIALLINNVGLFIAEVIGYHACHSVVMLLDGYYHLCQAILCAVRLASRSIQFTYTSRQTYGLARVGVVGELVAFVSFLSLSVSVFLESIKHLVDATVVIPNNEMNSSTPSTAHDHMDSQIAHPRIILGVGIYATISNCVLGVAILYSVMKRAWELHKQLEQRRPSLQQPLPKKLLSKSLLISDTLPIHHSFLQVLNMLLGPLALLTCGILLVVLSERKDVLLLYSRLVDPSICCALFLSYLVMIFVPMREVMHLVLQANPCPLNCDEIEKLLRDAVPGISSIHELHIWRLSPQKTLATVHIVFNSKQNILTRYDDINFIFRTLQIDHVTIQPEFSLTSDQLSKTDCQYLCATEQTACASLQCCENQTTSELTLLQHVSL